MKNAMVKLKYQDETYQLSLEPGRDGKYCIDLDSFLHEINLETSHAHTFRMIMGEELSKETINRLGL